MQVRIVKYMLLKQCVEQASWDIINGNVDGAHKRVFDRMTSLTQNKIFDDKDLELLPAYLLLAEANICMRSQTRESWRILDYS